MPDQTIKIVEQLAAKVRAETAERQLEALMLHNQRQAISEAKETGRTLGYTAGWNAAKQRYGWWQRLWRRMKNA